MYGDEYGVCLAQLFLHCLRLTTHPRHDVVERHYNNVLALLLDEESECLWYFLVQQRGVELSQQVLPLLLSCRVELTRGDCKRSTLVRLSHS